MLVPSILGAGLLVLLGGAALAYVLVDARRSPLHDVFDAYAETLDRRARFLFLKHEGRRIAKVQALLLGASLVIAVLAPNPFLIVLAAVLAAGPPFVLARLCARRVRRLEDQLDAWLVVLASSLRASPSVADAIESTLSLVPAPFSQEIDLVVKEMRLGASLHSAVSAMTRRIGSAIVSGALSTILVASQTGGNLSGTLDKAAEVLRGTRRLEGVLRTKTAEGRGQVLLLASTPFVLFVVIGWIDPAWFAPVLSHLYGRAILGLCAVLWITATFWAYRIVTVNV